MLTKKDKEDIKEVVVDVVKDVVMPTLESMHGMVMVTKEDVKKLGNRVKQIDRKLDRFSARVTDHDNKLGNHEKRLSKLEQNRTIA